MDLDIFLGNELEQNEENDVIVPLLYKALITGGIHNDLAMTIMFKTHPQCVTFGKDNKLDPIMSDILWQLSQVAERRKKVRLSVRVSKLMERNLSDEVVLPLAVSHQRNTQHQKKQNKRLFVEMAEAVENNCKPIHRSQKSSGEEGTMLAKRSKLTKRVLKECWELFMEIGLLSPKFCEIFGEIGERTPSDVENSMMEATFLASGGKPIGPTTASSYRRDAQKFMKFCKVIKVGITSVTPFQVAA